MLKRRDRGYIAAGAEPPVGQPSQRLRPRSWEDVLREREASRRRGRRHLASVFLSGAAAGPERPLRRGRRGGPTRWRRDPRILHVGAVNVELLEGLSLRGTRAGTRCATRDVVRVGAFITFGHGAILAKFVVVLLVLVIIFAVRVAQVARIQAEELRCVRPVVDILLRNVSSCSA